MGKVIGFFADGLPFDGETILHRSLGGSESAVYYMARELRLLGYEVWVVNNCDRPGTYEGVRYVHKRDFGSLALRTEFDVFIVSRFYNFFQVPFRFPPQYPLESRYAGQQIRLDEIPPPDSGPL